MRPPPRAAGARAAKGLAGGAREAIFGEVEKVLGRLRAQTVFMNPKWANQLF